MFRTYGCAVPGPARSWECPDPDHDGDDIAAVRTAFTD